jgi:lipoprotein-anchoring transpeptidase ErfK/SrfK
MSINELARLNEITNPDLIYAGQQLIVSGTQQSSAPEPQPTSDPALPSNTVTHVVQGGETLASIAQRYGISWLQIAQANNIYDADYVNAGEELLIPGGSVLNGAEFSFVSAPAAPPARVGVGKEIIVDLSDSRTYAYEDGKLVRNVLSSMGRPATPTVQGTFRVQRTYAAQTMTGPGYYLPDVPYVLYFYAGYALHGTYWHNNFGQPMSHGCVNLPTPEAGWFYDWAEVGTPVHVQP